jgi:tRNA-specific 2-thiouridylase
MENNKKIVVGFSGGVDSMMTIKILQEQGYQPIAVFLKMFAGEKIEEVRHLADKLAVKLIVKDVSKIFSNCIIGDFLNEYKSNRTPNPCVKCNFEIKFKFLLEMADELRIDKIATGHYAQIKKEGKFFKLLKGKDEKKDQSYFLYRLTQKELARIIFPLGGRQKEDVKKEALKMVGFMKSKNLKTFVS